MVMAGEILAMAAGPLVFCIVFVPFLMVILYLIQQRKVWGFYIGFPLLFLAAFGRMRWAMEECSINPDKVYHLEGIINKVVEREDQWQLYVMNPLIQCSDTEEKTHLHGVVLYVDREEEYWLMGDVIACDVRLSCYPQARNPGNFDQKKYYETLNIQARGYPEKIQVLKKNQNPWVKGIFQLKRRLVEVYKYIGLDEDAGLYTSILLGDKSLLDVDVKKMYQDNGMAHILAISGLHIAILGMGLYRILRKCCIPFVPCFVICSILMVSYGIMTGNGVSVLRAVSMFLISVMADVLGRSYDMPSAMALAAIVIILVYPKIIFNSGFLLSFLAVLGIMLVKPALWKAVEERFLEGKGRKKQRNPILDSILTSLSVNVMTLPVLLSTFYVFPIYSIFLNIIVLPLMSLMMFSAMAAGLMGLFCLPAAVALSGLGHYVLWFYKKLCEFFLQLPYAVWITGKPGWIGIILYYGFIMLGLLLVYYGVRSFMELIIIGVVCLVVRREPLFCMRMLDVGQGECIHITSQGTSMMVDAGSTGIRNVGEYRLEDYFKSQGVGKLDYVVITHADQDHISAILEIMGDEDESSERSRQDGFLEIGCLILPDISPRTESYEKVVRVASSKNIPIHYIHAGEKFYCGNILVECLHPALGYPYDSQNDYSTVIRLTYEDYQVLLTGDLEDSGENYLLENGLLNDIDMLKVAHHGSGKSTDEEFLSVVQPEIALISCGAKNSYGHPHKELLMRLETVGTKVFRTDELGAIEVKIEKGEVVVSGYVSQE